jgi:hypothetical protein
VFESTAATLCASLLVAQIYFVQKLFNADASIWIKIVLSSSLVGRSSESFRVVQLTERRTEQSNLCNSAESMYVFVTEGKQYPITNKPKVVDDQTSGERR